jgi:NAD(P)-dependent dehydrogenase (short-subunit alcohol dehydrogenase family)
MTINGMPKIRRQDMTKLIDPTKKYPVLAIPEQRQTEPGLDAALEPKADHGDASYKGSGRLEGRKALITGGDSGIGRAVAIAYAREGADVAFTHLPAELEDAEETAKLIEQAGQTAIRIEGDLTKESFAKELVEQAVTGLGGLDILVNNAGKQIHMDDITKITTKQLTDTFTVNIFAMFWIVQAAMKHLQPGSSIINTTSIQSYSPSAGLLDYAATKGAITNFTKGLSSQLIEKGIRVNAVAPGPIWTPLQPSYGQPMEKLVKFGQESPMGRPGQPAELAGAYVFLASEDASYVTGEIIAVTGGMPIS